MHVHVQVLREYVYIILDSRKGQKSRSLDVPESQEYVRECDSKSNTAGMSCVCLFVYIQTCTCVHIQHQTRILGYALVALGIYLSFQTKLLKSTSFVAPGLHDPADKT